MVATSITYIIFQPKTVKENAIIEKTALFVCRQGPQMEILIKAKQGENPQFSFLNQGDRLNRFYRHVLTAFKSGIYKGYDSMNVLNSGEYLHSLMFNTILNLKYYKKFNINFGPKRPSDFSDSFLFVLNKSKYSKY